MAIVDINIIKEWFKNLKKPTQEQFWTWLDSFRHKWEKVPLDDVDGLTIALQKKADLVNGVVPESQLPFTINTNEVINIGLIEVTTNNVKINVHESGSNKVRINGQIIERSFVNNLPFTAVTEGNKFLRIFAKNELGLFFLKQSAESYEPQEPALDAGEIHVRLILITPDGSYIDPELLNGFKTKAEDTWKTEFPNKLGNFALNFTDERTCFSLETATPSATTKTLQTVNFGAETTRDVEFTIKNNTLGLVTIPSIATEGLFKGFADNTPFTIPVKGTVFAKYNHVRNVVEILKVASNADMTAYHTITQYQQWVSDQSFATNTELTTGLNNRYVIASTSIASPDATYLYAVMSSAAGVTRRLDLSTYLTANYAALSNLVTSWSATPTHSKFASEKLVKDSLDALITGLTQPVKIISANTTVDNTFHNAIVIFLANATLTIPTGLRVDLNFSCFAKNTAVASFVAGSGVLIYAPTGLVLRDNAMCTLFPDFGLNLYNLIGGLVPA